MPFCLMLKYISGAIFANFDGLWVICVLYFEKQAIKL